MSHLSNPNPDAAWTVFAAGTTVGSAVWDYLHGQGLFTPSAFIAGAGFAVGFLANYSRIREGVPKLLNDLKSFRKWFSNRKARS